MDVGLRVVRGPGWCWVNQDGGEGHVGTVVEIGRCGSNTSPDKTVVVQWDCGTRTNYRVGYQGAYDLRVFDNSPIGIHHPQIRCTECAVANMVKPGEVYPTSLQCTTSVPSASLAHSAIGGVHVSTEFIRGTRWQCARCSHIDLCSLCYHSDKHELTHSFFRIEHHLATPVKVPHRQNSTKIEALGIFRSAKVVRGTDWDWGNQDGGDGRVGHVLDIRGWDKESGRSVANISWTANSTTNVYRVGHKGKVDVKLSENGVASGGYYYRDHLAVLGLPLLTSNVAKNGVQGDISASKDGHANVCRTSSSFCVGDRVKVSCSVAELRQFQEGHGGWNEKMAEFVGQVGAVHRITERGDVRVQFDNCPNRWTFHPAALRIYAPTSIPRTAGLICAGSLVRVSHNQAEVSRLQKNHGEWTEGMRSTLGRLGRIEKVYADGDVRVNVAGKLWTFNAKSIEPLDMTHQVSSGHLVAANVSVELSTPQLPPPAHQTSSMGNNRNDAGLTMILEKLVELVDTNGPDRLVREAAEGHFELVQDIITKHPDKVDVKSSGKTALQVAVHQGHVELTRLLVQAGARLSLVDEDGDAALHYACFGNQPSLVEYLLECGASMNMVNNGGCTALHVAVNKQHASCVAVLLQRGADINICDSYGDTALHDAIGKPSTEIVDMLVQEPSVKVSIRNRRGFDCLHQAALKGNASATKSILRHFPEASSSSKDDGYVALHLAALNGHVDVAEALLVAGANLEVINHRGETPLLLAVSQGRLSIARLLIERGARLDAVDGDGDSVLHLSLMRTGVSDNNFPDSGALLDPIAEQLTLKASDRPEGLPNGLLAAAWLVEQGAPLTIRNKQGQTPLDMLQQDEAARAALAQWAVVVGKRRDQPDQVCLVCKEDLTEVTFEPCGHRHCCRDCCVKMRRCYSCGQTIEAKRLDTGELMLTTVLNRLRIDTCAVTQELNQLRSRLQELECSICMDAPRAVAFLCGHSACAQCAQTLRVCHMCRKAITKKINLF